MPDLSDVVSISDYDKDDILSNFSSDIAVDSILDQIENVFNDGTISNKTDLFEVVEQQYKFIREKYKDKEELLEEIKDVLTRAVDSIQAKLEEVFDFKITFSDIILFDDRMHSIHMIYTFFVCSIEEDIESLLYNYFLKNIKNFPEGTINKKDLRYISFKKLNIENKYLNALYNFEENLETILEYKDNYVCEDIIELMIEDDPMLWQNFWVERIFIDNILVEDIDYGDNFINKIINEDIFNSSIITKVESRLIKYLSSDKPITSLK